ncbi:MAG: TatD family hydrolase [Bacteroidales bacterium]
MKLDEDIKFIDFHSHRADGEGHTLTIKNLFAGEEVPVSVLPGIYFSAGIHPWHLTEENAVELLEALKNTLVHPRVIAVGEAGFDRLKGPSENFQYDAFICQARLAEEFYKPVVIHAVRSWEILRKAKKEVNPSVKWIIHGFRGKAQLASDLVSESFMISLGVEGISPEVVEAAGLQNILLETDDSGRSISSVYSHLAVISGVRLHELIDRLKDNFNSCFIIR